MACPKCAVNPFSHSFVPFGIALSGEATLYYTAPARMTSRDDYSNLQCWTLHLDAVKGPWVWVIDCANMELHHSITMQFAEVFANILAMEHSKHLRRIVVLNPNVWFYGVVHGLYRSLPARLLDSIWYVRIDQDLNRMRKVLNIPSEAMEWLRITRSVNPNRRIEGPPSHDSHRRVDDHFL